MGNAGCISPGELKYYMPKQDTIGGHNISHSGARDGKFHL